MTRPIAAAAIVATLVFTSAALAQIRGPARRAAAGAAAVAGAPGVGARIEAREAARGVTPGDRWRYVNHGNQWWYYTPQNSWMYYQNNAWAPYDAASYRGAGAPVAPLTPAGYGANPDSWRYVYNGNRWWYYTPQQSWMVHNGNQWSAYAAAGAVPRYQTGYRGNYGDNNQLGNRPQVPVGPNAAPAANAPVQDRAPAIPNNEQPPRGDVRTPNTLNPAPAPAQAPDRVPAPPNGPRAATPANPQPTPQTPARDEQPTPQPRD